MPGTGGPGRSRGRGGEGVYTVRGTRDSRLGGRAGRKKLVLYKWRAGTSAESGLFEAEEGCFEPFSEVGLPEPMRWMAWGGEKQLWLALKQRYVKLSVGSLEMVAMEEANSCG